MGRVRAQVLFNIWNLRIERITDHYCRLQTLYLYVGMAEADTPAIIGEILCECLERSAHMEVVPQDRIHTPNYARA